MFKCLYNKRIRQHETSIMSSLFPKFQIEICSYILLGKFSFRTHTLKDCMIFLLYMYRVMYYTKKNITEKKSDSL